MAQTTHLALFGPILVIVGLPVAYFVYYIVYTMKYKLVLEKTRNKKNKKLTYGPNDARCIVWARSLHLHPPCQVVRVLQFYIL